MSIVCNTKAHSEELLTWALRYAALGLRVLPLRGKIPAAGHGVKDATRDEATIRRWFGPGTCNTGVGIAAGKTAWAGRWLVVLDSDTLRADGWLRAKLPEASATWQVRTGSGGHHYYLVADYEIRSSVDICKRIPGVSENGHSIDVRGEDGYVVAPPSAHPEGGTYTWEPEHGPGLEPGNEAALASLPRWMVAGQPAAAELFVRFWPAPLQALLEPAPQPQAATAAPAATPAPVSTPAPAPAAAPAQAAEDPTWARRRAYVQGAIPRILSDIATAGSGPPRHNAALTGACKLWRWIAEPRLGLVPAEIEGQLLAAMHASKPEIGAKDRAEFAQILKFARAAAQPFTEADWGPVGSAQTFPRDELDRIVEQITWPSAAAEEEPSKTPQICPQGAQDAQHEQIPPQAAQAPQAANLEPSLPAEIEAFISACDPDRARGTAALGIACIVLALTGCSIYSRAGSVLAAPTRVQEHHFLAEPGLGKTYLTSLIRRIARDMSSPAQPIAVVESLANSREALEDLLGAELCVFQEGEDGEKPQWVPRDPLPHVLVLWDEFAAQTADQIRTRDVFTARRQAFVNSLQSGVFQPTRARGNSKGPQWPAIEGLNVVVVSMDQLKNGRVVLGDTAAEGASRRRALWSIECRIDAPDDAPVEERAYLRRVAVDRSFDEHTVIEAARRLRERAVRDSAIDLPALDREGFLEAFRLGDWAACGFRPYRAPELGGDGLCAQKIEYFAALCAKVHGLRRVDAAAYRDAAAIVRQIAAVEQRLFEGEGELAQDDAMFAAMFEAETPGKRQAAYEPWRLLQRVPQGKLPAFRDYALAALAIRSTGGGHYQFSRLVGAEIAERAERLEMPAYRVWIDAVQTSSRAALATTLRAALRALEVPPSALPQPSSAEQKTPVAQD